MHIFSHMKTPDTICFPRPGNPGFIGLPTIAGIRAVARVAAFLLPFSILSVQFPAAAASGTRAEPENLMTQTSSATAPELPEAPVFDLRDEKKELARRTIDYMSLVIGSLGPGQSWPGVATWRSAMVRYHEVSARADASNLAEDKKKHIKACAKISAVVKGFTGSSAFAYFAAMSIGFGKEIYDKSFLNPTGGRDHTDLDADSIGAMVAYDKPPMPELDSRLPVPEEIDARYLGRLKERIEALRARHLEMMSRGDAGKAADLMQKEIEPLQRQLETLSRVD